MLDIQAIYNIGSGLRSTWLFSTCVMSQPCKQRQRCHSGFCWKDGRLTAGTARRPFWGQMPHGEAFERCSGLCEVCFWRRIWVRAGMDVQCWCWRTCAGWEKKKRKRQINVSVECDLRGKMSAWAPKGEQSKCHNTWNRKGATFCIDKSYRNVYFLIKLLTHFLIKSRNSNSVSETWTASNSSSSSRSAASSPSSSIWVSGGGADPEIKG